MAWTTRELEILSTTARVSSAFSLCGALFIIITFCCSKSFHRPINRLAFFAAFGNIMTNVATMTTRNGIEAGIESDLCRVQAVFIQWLLPADALFCLAMAWNVYLTVFKKYTTTRLKRLEPIYVAACYGLPFVIALTFVFVRDTHGVAVYGSATLWCWVSSDWQILRVAAFYGPVWIVVVATCVIYILAGRVIFSLRKNLRKFAKEPPSSYGQAYYPPHRPAQTLPADSGFGAIVEMEPVEPYSDEESKGAAIVAATPASVASPPPLPRPPPLSCKSASTNSSQRRCSFPSYTCTIESKPLNVEDKPAARVVHGHGGSGGARNAAIEANTAAWAYCRCAMLFFLALIITWLPSSVNRVYTLRYPEATPFGLNFAAALVLPAQGFWNGLIYIVTTLPACKAFMKSIFSPIITPIRRCWKVASSKKSRRDSMESSLADANLVTQSQTTTVGRN